MAEKYQFKRDQKSKPKSPLTIVTRDFEENELVPWAEDSVGGDTVEDPSLAKIREGWVVEKPPLQWVNWLYNLFHKSLIFAAETGIQPWDDVVTYNTDSVVMGSDGVIYQSVIDSNLNSDPSGSANPNWSVVVDLSELDDHINAADPHSQYTLKEQNLADLVNAATARTNLGLGNSATKNSSSSTSSSSTATVADSKAVKDAYDLANGAIPQSWISTALGQETNKVPSNKVVEDAIAAIPEFPESPADDNNYLRTNPAVKSRKGKARRRIGAKGAPKNKWAKAAPTGSWQKAGNAALYNKSDSVTSTSSTQIATSKAAKSAYDRGTTGINNAATAQSSADSAQATADAAMPKSWVLDSPTGTETDKPPSVNWVTGQVASTRISFTKIYPPGDYGTGTGSTVQDITVDMSKDSVIQIFHPNIDSTSKHIETTYFLGPHLQDRFNSLANDGVLFSKCFGRTQGGGSMMQGIDIQKQSSTMIKVAAWHSNTGTDGNIQAIFVSGSGVSKTLATGLNLTLTLEEKTIVYRENIKKLLLTCERFLSPIWIDVKYEDEILAFSQELKCLLKTPKLSKVPTWPSHIPKPWPITQREYRAFEKKDFPYI